MQKKSNNFPSDEFLQEMLFPKEMWEKTIKTFSQVITVTLHHFYITGDIEEEVDRYIEMINTLKTAEAHDQIYIYLNTPGGSVATTIQIVSAISQSPAHVTTVIEGEVCSAGTLIFLAGHDYIVNDHCTMMIHNYSHGPVGKGGEVKSQVDYSERYFKKLAEHFYEDFLTPEEIRAVCDDRDFWFDSEEIMERLERKGVKIRESLSEVEADIFNDDEEEEETPTPTPTPRTRKRKTPAKKSSKKD